MLKIKRAYEAPAKSDGFRVLVERLWPRGIRKSDAALDIWLKDVAPTPELRKWFSHDPAKWEAFRVRYWSELKPMYCRQEIMFMFGRYGTANSSHHDGASGRS